MATPFPAEVVDEYTRKGFWRTEVLAADLVRLARDAPDREFVVDGATRLTYGEAGRLLERCARGLAALGAGVGDCVVVQLPNWHEFVLLHFAIELLGAICVPLPPLYRAKEVGHILRITEAKIVVVPTVFRNFDHVGMVGELAATAKSLAHVITVRGNGAVSGVDVLNFDDLVGARADAGSLPASPADPNALSEIAFTSGSTGDPKGVMHTSNTLTIEHEAGIRGCNVTSEDVIFMASTIGHQLGLSVGIRTPVILGTKVVFLDHWDPEEAVALMARERTTYTVSTPTFLLDVLRTEALSKFGRLPAMKTWMLAGAVVPESLHEEVRQKMPHLRLAHVFGMTEVGGMIIKPTDAPREKALATGVPQPGLELRVFDASGAEVPDGVDGELALRSPSLFLGYFKQPEITAQSFVDSGFFLTGDQVKRDADGWIWVTGRIKDLIKRGGENISPLEIEEVLLKHPKVSEAAVIGLPDARLGERVCAVLALRANENMTSDEVVDCLKASGAAKQKWPERVEFVASLPRTSIGKIHKAELRARFARS